MKKFGWVYLLASLIGAACAIIEAITPTFIFHRFNIGILLGVGIYFITYYIISPLICISSIIVFVMVCRNRLNPRWLFLSLFSYNILYLAFAFGPFMTFRETAILVNIERLSWFGYIYWFFLVTWITVSFFGIFIYSRLQVAEGGMASWPLSKIFRHLLMFLACLTLAYFEIIFTDIYFGKVGLHGIILGEHAIFGIFLFPFYAVASYYLLGFFLDLLNRRS